ncbi:MAG: hypothetical protein QOH55_2234 [Microbacteriaceae bacterium]|jgi:hypothetical protein|nr:hypothetical protein [Microbacteriaceae bacterium]
MSRIATDAHATHPAVTVWRRFAGLSCRSRSTLALASFGSLVVLAIGVLAGILSS